MHLLLELVVFLPQLNFGFVFERVEVLHFAFGIVHLANVAAQFFIEFKLIQQVGCLEVEQAFNLGFAFGGAMVAFAVGPNFLGVHLVFTRQRLQFSVEAVFQLDRLVALIPTHAASDRFLFGLQFAVQTSLLQILRPSHIG
eukprot:CAMPEP_0116901630 /NCGR_PEP_ID=MMETSP0467-20121206/9487_1 /TAXON_ID=283647 /ORGANISM="Mesodinium pulex, Strain SPMC105" /LENGTH=140 /DNA_ID=CAMNT_0004575219 /DNA_START=2602 /DNA_END=3024 /DNA_ORIENTATION=+